MSLFIDALLPLGLGFIMFALGLGLTAADFTRVVTRPRAVLIGTVAQMVMLPLTAFALLHVLPIDPVLSVGLMILAFSPGGVVTNLLTRIAHGDVALSVTLTATVSLSAIVTLPPLVDLAGQYFGNGTLPPVDVGALALRMAIITALPIMAGMALRAALPGLSASIEPALYRLSGLVFAGIILSAIALNLDVVLIELPTLGPLTVTLMVTLLVLGLALGRFAGLAPSQARTIAIETSVQNGTVGLVAGGIVAGSTAEASGFILPSAVYGVLTYVVIVPLVLILFRRPAGQSSLTSRSNS